MAPRHDLEGGSDEYQEELSDPLDGDEEASGSTADSWQPLRPSGGRLPRIVSNQVLDAMLNDSDEVDGFDFEEGEFSLERSNFTARRERYSRERFSFDSDDFEGESLRSAAMTAVLGGSSPRERFSGFSERASNETISSFLDDTSDGTASVGSPRRVAERGGGWAPPRGVFKDAEMTARVAKAKGFEADEIHAANSSTSDNESVPKTTSKTTRAGKSGGPGPAHDPLGKQALKHALDLC